MRDYTFIKLLFGIKSLFYFYYNTVHLFIKDFVEKYYYYHILKVVFCTYSINATMTSKTSFQTATVCQWEV